MTTIENTIVVRLRVRGLEAFRWMDIPAQEWCCETAEEAHIFCQVMVRSIPETIELRWNWKDSLQGHYIQKG